MLSDRSDMKRFVSNSTNNKILVEIFIDHFLSQPSHKVYYRSLFNELGQYVQKQTFIYCSWFWV